VPGGGSEKSSEKGTEKILSFFEGHPEAGAGEIAALLGITQRAVEKQIASLKAVGRLKRIGPDKGGRWEVVK